MIRPGRATPLLRSVRTKLLVMLAVLSLPLLVLSLYQLNNYRRNLNDQAAPIAPIKTNAAAGALKAWLDHRSSTRTDTTSALPDDEARNLYGYLRRNASPEAGDIVVVYDEQGRALRNPSADGPIPATSPLASGAQRLKRSEERR